MLIIIVKYQYQTLKKKKKKKKQIATIVFIKKHMQFNQTHTYTHAINSMPYKE